MIDNKMPALSLVPTENQTELKQTTTNKTYLERMISFEEEQRCCCCCCCLFVDDDNDANVAICLLHALLIPAAKD
jgi:hypothetical protein